MHTQSQSVSQSHTLSGKSQTTHWLRSPIPAQGQPQEMDSVFDLLQRHLDPWKQVTLSFGTCCIFLEVYCACVCARACVSFSTFQVFYCQFESSWQNLQVFSGTDAWGRRDAGSETEQCTELGKQLLCYSHCVYNFPQSV